MNRTGWCIAMNKEELIEKIEEELSKIDEIETLEILYYTIKNLSK